MTAKELSLLEYETEKVVRDLKIALAFAKAANGEKVTMTVQRAESLLKVLTETGDFLGYKLDTTEINANGRNKRRSKRKHK